VLEKLLEMDLRGRRVAIQQHGEPLPDVVEALEAVGATVIEVQVYRWQPPVDLAPLEKLCRAVADRLVDAVTFTSAPAAASFLQTAVQLGIQAPMLVAMQHDVKVLAVGPVTAAPLDRAGLPVVQPQRARLGALVREIADELPRSAARHLVAAGQRLEIRGHGLLVDECFVALPPTGMALLNRLTAPPGPGDQSRGSRIVHARWQRRRACRRDGDRPSAHRTRESADHPDPGQTWLPGRLRPGIRDHRPPLPQATGG